MGHPLAIVVVAYNNPTDLNTCLVDAGTDFPVVVVDNSSSEAVAAVAHTNNALYVDSGANLGFAAGVNLGIRRLPSNTDVLLLNPDAVISATSIAALHDSLRKDPNVGAVSPRLYIDADREERSAWPFPTPGRMWREALGISRLRPPPNEFVIGAVLALRREAIDAIGGFDERFFLYAEETDWQRRAVQRGWASKVVDDVVAQHRGAGTSTNAARREELFHAGIETYVRKWFGTSGWASYRAAALTGAAIRIIVASGPKRDAARDRLRLYWRGPLRAARLA
jgi:GT2 family glycosyltransferase